jgi:hypothetical protein
MKQLNEVGEWMWIRKSWCALCSAPSGVIRHTSRASDRCAARAGRSTIGIFIKQKDD